MLVPSRPPSVAPVLAAALTALAPLASLTFAAGAPPAKKPVPKAPPKAARAVVPSPKAALKPARNAPIFVRFAPVKAVPVKAAPKAAAPALRSSLAVPVVSTVWENSYVEVLRGGRARINYEAGVVKATGLGAVAPASLSRSQAQRVLDAREAALVDALRSLSLAVSQVRVSADTRAVNYMLKSDDVRVRVQGVVKHAEVIEEKLLPGTGIYRLVVQVPLSGDGSVAQALGVEQPVVEKVAAEIPQPLPEEKPNPFAPGAPAPEGAEYTSLIVDCRGLRIEACMSPRLMDEDGREVYGKVFCSPEYAIETGIVAFPRSWEAAQRCTRAGGRPLIVKARRVADRFRFHPVISERDARRIQNANQDSRFFERTAVIFLVDPV